MATGATLSRWAGARLSRRLARSVPWIGAAVALATVASTVRRKGWLGGAADTALNSIPFVGALKSAAEVARGRDFIRDRGQHNRYVRPIGSDASAGRQVS